MMTMTPQAMWGLALIALGVCLRFFAQYKQIPGDLGYLGELDKVGAFLLGKEWALPSASAMAKRASMPPKAGAVGIVLALLLCGCGGAAVDALRPDYPEHAARVEALDEQLDDAAVKLAKADGTVRWVCRWRGDDAAECIALRTTYDVATKTLGTTRATVALYQASGVAIEAAELAVGNVLAAAENLAGEVSRLEEVIHAEIRGARDRLRAMDPQPPAEPAPVSGT